MVKPYLLQTLKEIALLSALNNKIEVSTGELAQQLTTSQQTASRYLMELDKLGLISRELGIKKQLIEITPRGSEILQDEYSQYQQIFNMTRKVMFKGKVVSGLGEGRYYTEQDGYVKQFKVKLGFIPYPGTLNVEIENVERNKLRLLKNVGGIVIDEFHTTSRSFGGVRCFPARIGSAQGAIVLPMRSHYSTILEFIAPQHLRSQLHLTDGDIVAITITLET
jgi:riboflavin kinase